MQFTSTVIIYGHGGQGLPSKKADTDGDKKGAIVMKYDYKGVEAIKEREVVWIAEGGVEQENFPLDEFDVEGVTRLALWGLHHALRNSIANARGVSDEGKLDMAREHYERLLLGDEGKKYPNGFLTALCYIKGLDMREARVLVKNLTPEEIQLASKTKEIKAAKIAIEQAKLEAMEGGDGENIDSILGL